MSWHGRRSRLTWLIPGVLLLPIMAAGSPPIAHAASHSSSVQRAIGGGDIGDNAVYLVYHGRGFSIEYVEGWLRTTQSHGILFNDKDSRVVVDLRPRLKGSLSAYIQRVDLPQLVHSAGFARHALTGDRVAGRPAMRLTYTGRSAPDDVTGKVVPLQIDRYYVDGPHSLAVITLSTPVGVDNVDAFRRISHSLRFA